MSLENLNISGNVPDEVELSTLLWRRLKLGEYDSITDMLKEENCCTYLFENCLEVVPVITKIFFEENYPEETVECVEEILMSVAKGANVKEVLMVLLEQLEGCVSADHLKVILNPLQFILLNRLPLQKKQSFISWAFNTLYSHISDLQLPEDYTLEGEEIKLLDCHPEIQTLYESLRLVHKFLFVFYEKILTNEFEWPGRANDTKLNFAFYVLKYFSDPFTHLDVYYDGKTAPSEAYDICTKFVDMVNQLLVNPLKTLDYILPVKMEEELNEVGESSESESFPYEDMGKDDPREILQVALGTYFYCLFSQHIGAKAVPNVYSSNYLYLRLISPCLHLFKQNSDSPSYKALLLMKAMLHCVDNDQLSHDFLDFPNLLDIPKALCCVMTFSNNQELRHRALSILKIFMRKFDPVGRLSLFCVLSNFKHSGFASVVIHELKENIVKALKNGDPSSCFLGSELIHVLMVVCQLPDVEDAALLDWSDKILSTLNLILFLLRCDKEKIAGLEDAIPVIYKDYVDPLHHKIQTAKEQLKVCLAELETGSKNHSQPVNFSVNNKEVPPLLPQQEIEALKSGFTWLDMIESVRAHIENLFANK